MNPRVEVYSRDKINKKYAKFLKGKRVALIGPANKTKGTLQGEMIDSYDIVVRMNLGFKAPAKIQKDVGKRLDILYCSLSNWYFDTKIFTKKRILELKKERNLKWFIGTGVHREAILKLASYNKSVKAGLKIRQVSRSDFKKIKSKLKSKPSAGIVAIQDLLRHDISELYISGFTFYNYKVPKSEGRNSYYYSGYNPGYKAHAGGVYNHNLKGEAKIVKKICKLDGRVKTDKILENILEEL